MKVINMVAVVDADKCRACKTCERVCPVLAIKVVDRTAVVDSQRCRGCQACEQRCPDYAITMAKLEKPFMVKVDVDAVDFPRVTELCRKARLNPEQVICYCTGTRAMEAAAAILQGAGSPEEVSLRTGARTGCKVECIQSILRLLEAAGIELRPPRGGWQWYARTVTAWEIPSAVKKKYGSRGFYFDEDIALLEEVAAAPPKRGE